MANKFSSASISHFLEAIMGDVTRLCSDILTHEKESQHQRHLDGLVELVNLDNSTLIFASQVIERLAILEPTIQPSQAPTLTPNNLSKSLTTTTTTSNAAVQTEDIVVEILLGDFPKVINTASSPAFSSGHSSILSTSEKSSSFSQATTDSTRKRGKIKTRPSRVFLQYQRDILLNEYNKNKYCEQERQTKLAKQLNLTEGQIVRWFRNRRFSDTMALKKSHKNQHQATIKSETASSTLIMDDDRNNHHHRHHRYPYDPINLSNCSSSQHSTSSTILSTSHNFPTIMPYNSANNIIFEPQRPLLRINPQMGTCDAIV